MQGDFDGERCRYMSSYFGCSFGIMCVLAILGACFCGFAPVSTFADPMFLSGFIFLMALCVCVLCCAGFAVYLVYDCYNTRKILRRQEISRQQDMSTILNAIKIQT